MSHVRCHVSGVRCQVSDAMCQVSGVMFFCVFFGQSGWASRWRVCYQRGLPRLVLLEQLAINLDEKRLWRGLPRTEDLWKIMKRVKTRRQWSIFAKPFWDCLLFIYFFSSATFHQQVSINLFPSSTFCWLLVIEYFVSTTFHWQLEYQARFDIVLGWVSNQVGNKTPLREIQLLVLKLTPFWW